MNNNNNCILLFIASRKKPLFTQSRHCVSKIMKESINVLKIAAKNK